MTKEKTLGAIYIVFKNIKYTIIPIEFFHVYDDAVKYSLKYPDCYIHFSVTDLKSEIIHIFVIRTVDNNNIVNNAMITNDETEVNIILDNLKILYQEFHHYKLLNKTPTKTLFDNV